VGWKTCHHKALIPYIEEEVVYQNPKANIEIAGTLTIPKGEGPFPAVLLAAQGISFYDLLVMQDGTEAKAGGNSDYTVRELPGLNHLFQTCSTGAFSEYVKIEETMSPPALQAVSDWIMVRTSVPRVNTP